MRPRIPPHCSLTTATNVSNISAGSPTSVPKPISAKSSSFERMCVIAIESASMPLSVATRPAAGSWAVQSASICMNGWSPRSMVAWYSSKTPSRGSSKMFGGGPSGSSGSVLVGSSAGASGSSSGSVVAGASGSSSGSVVAGASVSSGSVVAGASVSSGSVVSGSVVSGSAVSGA